MSLPIEVISVRPLKFRWTVQTIPPVGQPVTLPCEGELPPGPDRAVAELVELCKRQEQVIGVYKDSTAKLLLEDQVAKLRAFKDWVHAYLDSKGVPEEFPDGPHSKEGCRIGDRLDYVFQQLRELDEEAQAWRVKDAEREQLEEAERRATADPTRTQAQPTEQPVSGRLVSSRRVKGA